MPPDLDLNYAFGHNFHNKATEKALVDAEQLKDDVANKVKETVVELGRAIRQTRSDSIKPIADYEGESDGHFFIRCRGESKTLELERRATFAERGNLTVEVGDELAVSGYDAETWFIATVDDIGEGNEGDERYRVSFLYDDTIENLKLKAESYGRGLREQHWGKRDAKVALGWMFLRPTKDVGGEVIENTEYLKF